MKIVLYKDEAGNKVIRDFDGTLAVINREGKLVERISAKRFLTRPRIRKALVKAYGTLPKLKFR